MRLNKPHYNQCEVNLKVGEVQTETASSAHRALGALRANRRARAEAWTRRGRWAGGARGPRRERSPGLRGRAGAESGRGCGGRARAGCAVLKWLTCALIFGQGRFRSGVCSGH